MTQVIDLRSDTVTKPNVEMRRAMYEAEVADDSYDGDPTVIRLQELAADKTGKESALFVTSGTMGNLCGVLSLTTPGQEVILGDFSHQFLWEKGGIARVAGLVTHTIPFHDGWLDPQEIEMAIRPQTREAAATGLICVEDTSNRGGGMVIPPKHLAKIAEVAKKCRLPVYMDGARLFNAAVAMNLQAGDFTQFVDAVSFCLSKGLGAPFGSLLCGSKEVIARAISARQMLGGGMRQAGIMAAAGIVALETGINRMAEDHANAKKLAQGLMELFPDCLDQKTVETNMFFIKVAALGQSGPQLAEELRKEGILVFPTQPRMRLTTHCNICSQDIDHALQVFARLRSSMRGNPYGKTYNHELS